MCLCRDSCGHKELDTARALGEEMGPPEGFCLMPEDFFSASGCQTRQRTVAVMDLLKDWPWVICPCDLQRALKWLSALGNIQTSMLQWDFLRLSRKQQNFKQSYWQACSCERPGQGGWREVDGLGLRWLGPSRCVRWWTGPLTGQLHHKTALRAPLFTPKPEVRGVSLYSIIIMTAFKPLHLDLIYTYFILHI